MKKKLWTKKKFDKFEKFMEKLYGQEVTIIFHQDADGCSSAALFYIYLKEFLNCEKITLSSIGTGSELTEMHIKNADDLVIILDIAQVNQNLVDKNPEKEILVIDHHPKKENFNCVYLNPHLVGEEGYSNSYFCYKLLTNLDKSSRFKKYLWIAGIGVIGDNVSEILKDFLLKIKTNYPTLIKGKLDQKNLFYNTTLGRLTYFIDLACKEKNLHILVIKKIIKNKDRPKDLFYDKIFCKIKYVEKELNKIIESAKKNSLATDSFILFKFRSKYNLKSQIANYLLELYPKKVVMVGYETKKEVLFSLRSKLNIDLNKLIKECLVDFDGSGGGHPKAIGGKIVKEQFEKLVEKIQVTLNN